MLPTTRIIAREMLKWDYNWSFPNALAKATYAWWMAMQIPEAVTCNSRSRVWWPLQEIVGALSRLLSGRLSNRHPECVFTRSCGHYECDV